MFGGLVRLIRRWVWPQLLEFKVLIVIEPDGKSFHAFCPSLKGLHVDGETKEKALQNAAQAAVLYLESLIRHGDPIPIGVGFDIHDLEQHKIIPKSLPKHSSCVTKELAVELR
jgi:predicted RNase H-like HicB family nuclease